MPFGQEISTAGSAERHEIHWILLVALHLVPGLFILCCYYFLSRILIRNGSTSYLALMITIAFCLVPVEAGIIFYYRPRSSGKNVRRDREYVKKGSGAFEYLCLPLFLFLIAGLLGLVFYPLTNYLESFFSPWIPEWVKPDNVMRGLRACSSNQRNAALMLGLVISGFAAPIVEEIYFRGFLLSKMQSIGKFAPAFNAFLFALYHMYNPWNIPAIFFAFLPIAYTVWYGKDIVVGIIAHIMINLFGVIQVFWLSRG